MTGLKKIQKIFFALLAFCLPISIAASNVAWGVAFCVTLTLWALEWKQRKYKWTGLEIPWLVFIGASVLAILLSGEPSKGWRFLRPECLVVIFFLMAQETESHEAFRYLKFFLAAAVFAAGWGCLQGLVGLHWNPHENIYFFRGQEVHWPSLLQSSLSLWNGRSVGFFNHPLTYAEVLLLAGALLLSFGMTSKLWKWWVLSLIVLGALIYSQSRGVWLSLGGTLFLWAWIKKRKLLWGVLGFLGIVGVIVVSVSPVMRERVQSVFRMDLNPSNKVRLGLWSGSLEKIKENPVWGVGPGQFLMKPEELRWGSSF